MTMRHIRARAWPRRTPHAAGVVAPMFSVDPNLTPGQVLEILQNFAEALTPAGAKPRPDTHLADPTGGLQFVERTPELETWQWESTKRARLGSAAPGALHR